MKLDLVLTHHWYDEVASGRKRVEYREQSDFWRKRIWERRGEIHTVTFRRGYSMTALTFRVTLIDTGLCPYPEWSRVYYRIYFIEEDKP